METTRPAEHPAMATDEQPKVTLHWLNGSRSQSILWLLEELNIPYDLKIYHRQSDLLAPPELAKIHPLGKSPVLTIALPGASEPVVLAEGPFIASYLCDHWGQGTTLAPARWKDGQEGKVGGETTEWLRFQYLLYFEEGSFMPMNLLSLILGSLKGPRIPFLVRPITSIVASRISDFVVLPNVAKMLGLLETFLDNSTYLCGDHLTAADVMMSYPLLMAKIRGPDMGTFAKGTAEQTFPKTFEYIGRIEKHPGYVKSADKIREIDGEFRASPKAG